MSLVMHTEENVSAGGGTVICCKVEINFMGDHRQNTVEQGVTRFQWQMEEINWGKKYGLERNRRHRT